LGEVMNDSLYVVGYLKCRMAIRSGDRSVACRVMANGPFSDCKKFTRDSGLLEDSYTVNVDFGDEDKSYVLKLKALCTVVLSGFCS
jgi:hypothetical protein